MTNNITIKSGIDINSTDFKEYYENLKKQSVNTYFLDTAVSKNSPVLSEPIIFDEKDYDDYNVDDISFIISDGEIIGHQVYVLEKKVPAIPLGMERGNHLNMDRVKKISSRITFGRKEYFCKYKIDIKQLVVEYLSNRIHGKLEYKGNIRREDKIHIKK